MVGQHPGEANDAVDAGGLECVRESGCANEFEGDVNAVGDDLSDFVDDFSGIHDDVIQPGVGESLSTFRPSGGGDDGETHVWYAILTANGDVKIEFISLEYDCKNLAAEMKEENLPQEFIDTILTGWWTTCLEILPAKERVRGKY